MGYKILEFEKLELPKDYLVSLPKPYLNFLISSSLIVNDLSVFSKILVGYSNREVTNHEEIHIFVIHQLVIFRVLGAKLFEAFEYLESFKKKVERLKNIDSDYILSLVNETRRMITKSPQWMIAEKIRNNVAHHYQLKDLDEVLNDTREGHRFMMLFAQRRANNFHPIGEEIGYLPAFSDPEHQIKAMVKWYIETTQILNEAQDKIIQDIFQKYPPPKGIKKKLFVDDDRIATEDTRLPYLWFKS